jgi:hypothetical protein
MARKYTPLDIGREESIKEGTVARVVEYDLAKSPNKILGFIPFGNQWEKLFKSWLERGVMVEVYHQAPTKETKKMLEGFCRQYGKRRFNSIGFEDVPDKVFDVEVPGGSNERVNKKYLVSQHFTLFNIPMHLGEYWELWKESKHLPNSPYMYGCSSFRGNKEVINGPKWKKDFRTYEQILKNIRKSKGIEINRPSNRRRSFTNQSKKGKATIVRAK